jgi:glycosyltransferase involved in cell wall biosynthesis
MDASYTLVVPCYNERDYLPATLDSLRQAMRAVPQREGRILVVDNGSSDGTGELARAAGAQVVFEPHRQIARARNAGGRAAHTPYLIFVDADTAISGALLASTLAALDSGRVCGGGAACRFDRGPLWLRLGLASWNLWARCARWAAGSYLFCLREAFLATGGFDESLYAAEEIALSRALKRWGRARGLRFRILREPVVTSARKIEWFGSRRMAGMLLRLALSPRALADRDRLPLWYTRPRDAGPSGKDE